MAGLLTLGIVLSAVDHLTPALGNATGELNTFESKVSSVSANITKLGTVSLGLGTALTAPIAAAYNSYQELAKVQGEIASLGINDDGIKAITASAREFSNEFAGTTASQFVQASYDIKSGISSLSDTAVGEFTKIAAMTGSATKSSTAQMTSLFASGYGIYKKQFDEFGATTIEGWNNLSAQEKDIKFGKYFSAGIASSVQAFKTDGANMSAAISNLGATATSANVSFAEQLSVLGMLQKTMSGSEAATKYRAFLGSASAAGETLGLTFLDTNNQLLSMPEILGQLKGKYGETLDAIESDELKKAFGTEEAVSLIKLFYSETDELSSSIKTMGKNLEGGTVKTKEMAKAMNKGKEWELLNQQINNVSTMIGSFFAPAASAASTALGGIVTTVGTWIEENESLAEGIGLTVGIVGGALVVFGSVAVTLGAIGMALPMVTGGFGLMAKSVIFAGTALKTLSLFFLTNPIGLGITALITLGTVLYNTFEPVKTLFDSVGGAIADFFGFGGDTVDAVPKASLSGVSTKGNNKSIENIHKEVNSSSNSLIKTKEPSVVSSNPTYNINVNNPSSNVDVQKAIKELERKNKNRTYEDID